MEYNTSLSIVVGYIDTFFSICNIACLNSQLAHDVHVCSFGMIQHEQSIIGCFTSHVVYSDQYSKWLDGLFSFSEKVVDELVIAQWQAPS